MAAACICFFVIFLMVVFVLSLFALIVGKRNEYTNEELSKKLFVLGVFGLVICIIPVLLYVCFIAIIG